jgi:hypothetical protein
MVKKIKPLETARVSRRDRGAYLALWAGNEPYNPGSLSDDGDGDSLWIGRILAYITGTVDQKLLLRNEYLRRLRIEERGGFRLDAVVLDEGPRTGVASEEASGIDARSTSKCQLVVRLGSSQRSK